MATCFSLLAWRIPWTEEPGRYSPWGPQRVGHDWSDLAHLHFTFFYFWFPESLWWRLESLESWLVEQSAIFFCERNGLLEKKRITLVFLTAENISKCPFSIFAFWCWKNPGTETCFLNWEHVSPMNESSRFNFWKNIFFHIHLWYWGYLNFFLNAIIKIIIQVLLFAWVVDFFLDKIYTT